MKDLEAGSTTSNGAGATPGQQESEVRSMLVPRRSQVGIGRKRWRVSEARLLRQYKDLDRRSLAYRETMRLIEAMQADLGGADQLSAAEKQMIQRAGILGALLAKQEAYFLKHQRIDAAEYCLVLNAQRRLFESLGIRRRPKTVIDLESYLASSRGTTDRD